mmetsp:Transcript_26246/g.4521  ORF Transcript_26246/g.4521 Transcript_26246/m.4521 type:complete len:91 (+) Transcript_26246:2938-3210(+)
MEGTVIVEAGIPTICIESEGLPTGYEVFLNSRDTDLNSILELRFTSTKFIPNGYFYLDGNYPGDQGYIEFHFEVYNSFAFDLAGQHDSDN